MNESCPGRDRCWDAPSAHDLSKQDDFWLSEATAEAFGGEYRGSQSIWVEACIKTTWCVL